MLLGIEYQNWYQVLRPFGSNVHDKSRVEVLKLADESDLRLRDNVPWGLSRSRDSLSAAVASHLESSQSLQKQSSEIITLLSLKKTDGMTYLSPRLVDFQDQDKEIEEIFWNLLKTASPTCPDDLDIEQIRAALAERRAKLGREQVKEDDEDDPFNKYGLGLHAKRPIGTEGPRPGAQGTGEGLVEMIDRMVAERTKPPPVKKDLYDKNNPIKGKVGFRRDPDGPRCFTDLDEQLSVGDLEKDTDYRRFLVETGKGMFDSQGNFVLLDDDEKLKKKKKHVSHADDSDDGLRTTRSLVKGKHRKRRTTEGSSASGSERGKSRQGRTISTMTDAEREAYLHGISKQRRYPEWEFPLCNYPKWVHRMYRMDQEKIGQLIKQGLDVPEYVPPWMLQVLDKVWGAKDPKSRGGQPSKKGRKGRRGGGMLDEGGHRDKGVPGAAASAAGAGGADGKKRVSAGEEGAERGGLTWDESPKHAEEDMLGGKGEADGMADFLQGYEREMIDLAKLEAADSDEKLQRSGDSLDIDDLIADYEKELERQEQELLDGPSKNREEKRADKLRQLKERQEAALRRIQEQVKKEQQEQKMKEAADNEKLEKENALLEKLKRDDSTHRAGGGKRGRHSKRDKSKKSTTASAGPCGEFTTTAGDRARDAECMRRFRVLLGRQSERLSAADFIEILRQEIPLFRYEPAPPKKTPCERVEVPIC